MQDLSNVEKLGFSQRQRLTFIEAVAYWEGAVDRPRVSNAFNVSENHVTKDFRFYKDTFPGNLQYDESSRVYRPTRRFRPRIGKGSAEEYLSLLRNYVESGNSVATPLSGGVVSADAVPYPQSHLDSAVLNAITRAITAKTGLLISYQSMNRSQPASRRIWPHALLFGGTRWHTRAYDEERGQFIDLVLQRILSAKSIDKESPISVKSDLAWSRMALVEVVPSRALSTGQAAVIAKEFGMQKTARHWVWSVRLRECLVGYFIYLHRLDLPNDPHRLIELREASTFLPNYFSDSTQSDE